MTNGHTWQCSITYDGSNTMSWTLQDITAGGGLNSYSQNIGSLSTYVGAALQGYMGFTGATGGSTSNQASTYDA